MVVVASHAGDVLHSKSQTLASKRIELNGEWVIGHERFNRGMGGGVEGEWCVFLMRMPCSGPASLFDSVWDETATLCVCGLI